MDVRFKFNSTDEVFNEKIDSIEDFYELFCDEGCPITVDFVEDKRGNKFIGLTINDSRKPILGFRG